MLPTWGFTNCPSPRALTQPKPRTWSKHLHIKEETCNKHVCNRPEFAAKKSWRRKFMLDLADWEIYFAQVRLFWSTFLVNICVFLCFVSVAVDLGNSRCDQAAFKRAPLPLKIWKNIIYMCNLFPLRKLLSHYTAKPCKKSSEHLSTILLQNNLGQLRGPLDSCWHKALDFASVAKILCTNKPRAVPCEKIKGSSWREHWRCGCVHTKCFRP